jgi:hypothetical protein
MAIALAAVFLAIGWRLPAQDRLEHLDEGIAPNARSGRASLPQDPDQALAPNGRTPRAALSRPDLRVEPVDPAVEQLLLDWSKHTERIKTLAGKHYRSIRDFTYGSETLAEGKFYIEMPDKGRLDIGNFSAPNPKAGDTKTYNAPDGKPTKLTIQLEKNHEKWVCDGKVVRVINDTRRSYEEVPIPPNQQGTNMIDGPLPFLLGMPPDKAKARYRFKLMDKTNSVSGDEAIWIEVKPRTQLDAAEWVRAYVLLNLRSYLPERVSLFNPAGTTETVYLFREIDTNKRGMLQNFFAGDPFKPSVFGYRREVHAPLTIEPKASGAASKDMPVLVGAPPDVAKQKAGELRARGFKVQFEPGPRAPNPAQNWHIASQEPAPHARLRDGQAIVLRYYVVATVNEGDRQ